MSSDAPTVVGVDVGGTRVKAVLARADGSVLGQVVVPTPPRPGPELGRIAAGLLARLETESATTAQALGLVVPGLVEDAVGIARWSANLGWRDLPLLDLLAASIEVPVDCGHDVRAGLLAEHRWGAAQACDDVLFVPLGTGIAAAQMVGGHVVAGSPWSGEVGHVVIRRGGRPCGCGAAGCLEAEASAAALGRAWSEAKGEPADAEDLAAAVRAGDPAAARIWQQAVDDVAGALAPALAAAGTRLVLVGGGLALAGDLLLDPLRAALAELLPGRDDLTVRTAELGDRAGALGAACLAVDALRSASATADNDTSDNNTSASDTSGAAR